MRYASYIISLIGTLALLASGAMWWNVFRQPEPAPAASRLQQYPRRANWAAVAIMIAFGLSVVAAVLASSALIF